MTTDDPVLAALSRANPEPMPAPVPHAQRLLERILAEAVVMPTRARAPRARLLVPAVSTAVVIAVAAVFLVTGSHRRVAPAAGPTTIVYRVRPTAGTTTVNAAAVRRQATLIGVRARVNGMSSIGVALIGHDEIAVTVGPGEPVTRAARALAGAPALELYDWEANVIAPGGRPVVDGLRAQSPRALELSQGRSGGPGTAGAGGMGLFEAVRLASRRAPTGTAHVSRRGPVYYRFQNPHSATCPGAHPCYLAGPVARRAQLADGGPGTRTLAVPQGTIVVQAAGQSLPPGSPRARFFVLRDRIGALATFDTAPTVARDPDGGSDVALDLDRADARQFQTLTRTLAHRGERLSLGATSEDQHVAVMLGGRLLGVEQVRFVEFPDGVVAVPGRPVPIAGGARPAQARELAAQLRVEAGAVALQRVSPAG